MPRALRILVIAPWGYPPQWGKADYTVSFQEHPLLRKIEQTRCRTCSSTIALMASLNKLNKVEEKYRPEVKALIIGLDTIVDPGAASSDNLRREAKRLYHDYFRQILQESKDCASSIDEKSVEIHVIPGIGRFYDWSFKGSIDVMFNAAFNKLVDTIESFKPSLIVLDLTHGINYQTIVVLYATVAATALLGKEKGLVMASSEPYPAGVRTPTCIKSERRKREEKESIDMNILDTTRLQKVIIFTRLMREIMHLNTEPINYAVKELEAIGQTRLATYIKTTLKPFVGLLANGIVAPTYPQSYIAKPSPDCNDEEEPVLRNPLQKEPPRPATKSYEPIINRREKTITYEEDTAYASLTKVIEVLVNNLRHKLGAENLQDYMVKVKSLYRELGYTHLYYLVNETLKELNDIANYLADKLQDQEATITVYTYRLLYSKKNQLAAKQKPKYTQNEIEKIIKQQIQEQQKQPDPSRDIRNMAAHSGLEFKYIESLTIRKNKNKPTITKITYRNNIKHLIQEFL